MSQTSDVIVVGGGINGTSIAFNLAKRGVHVTLVEKDFIAAGPTGRSSAIIRQHYSNEVTARMALRSLRIWQDFADAVGGDAGFKQPGFLVGASEENLDALKANIALQQSVGINTRFVSPGEMKAIEPHVSTEGVAGAAYEPEGGYADATAAANAFAAAARRLGATVLQATPVTSIQTEAGRVTGVVTSQGPIAAGAVIVAAGPWTPLLARTTHIDLPITACRVQVCFYQWPPEFRGHMVYADFVNRIYLRPETGRQMLVGSVDPAEAEDRVDDPDHFNERPDFEMVSLFAEQASQRYPAMERGVSAGGYASVYDITPDWHPIIDELPGVAGLYCCAGGSGHSFKLSPATGEMVAGLVMDGKHPGDDVQFFSFDRFARDQLIRGKYEYSISG
ncbi:MAG: FAD-binding oxidoreductase [Ardenticatenaceae bacterium]|nr:FAD-binding oxidoreductase [Ardenticatenaceae bacterium]